MPTPRDTTDPLRRARHAVVEARQRVAGEERQAAEQERAQQLTSWHVDDQVSALHQRAHDDGAPALTEGVA